MSTATITERPAKPNAVSEDEAPLFRAQEQAPLEEVFDAQDEFNELADELEEAAAGLSSTRRAMAHPAFAEILAMGNPAISPALQRLCKSSNRPLWLRVLGTLTPFPPGAGASNIDDAAATWIRWGAQKGLTT